jgi:hypothetical protein
MKGRLVLALCCCLGLVLSACKEQAPQPFLKIVGGSFMFNYRYSKMTYGFVARQLRPLPEGSVLEASFDLPQTERKFVVTQPAKNGKLHYGFETEALRGVQKNIPYKVRLKLLEATTGKELELVEQVFKSDVDQDTLPVRAPVVGIGYQTNPEN